MNWPMIIYGASTVLSLYAAYLFTFRVYGCDFDGNPTKPILFPRIAYIMAVLLSFVPVMNTICVLAALVSALMLNGWEIYIDSWLFRKPSGKAGDSED